MRRLTPESRFVAVGQLTADTTVLLDSQLALGDQCVGQLQRSLGGTAAIAAHNAAVLGLAPVSFIGHCGDDRQGRAALAELVAAGVTIGPLVTTPTSPEVLVIVDSDGERTMIAAPGEPDWSVVQLDLGEGDVVLFEGWHLFSPCGFDALIGAARRAGALIAIDVCSASRSTDPRAHAQLLRVLQPDILLANEAEAAIYGLEPASVGTVVVVHAGGSPTRIWREREVLEIPVDPRRVVDTTGAGDTFAAVMLASLAAGWRLEDAVVAAHEAAGRVVEQVGPLLRSQHRALTR